MFTLRSSTALAALLLAASAVANDPTPSHVHLPAWQPGNLPDGARFGVDVALEGSLAAVSSSAPDVVMTYEQVDGIWSQVQPIASPIGGDDSFGDEVVMHDGRLFVSAPWDGVFLFGAGAVHVYEQIGGAWTHVQSLRDDTPVVGGFFGTKIAADGDWLAIGSPNDDPDHGSIHVYRHVDGGYERVHVITNGFSTSFGLDFTLRAREDGDTVDLFVGDRLTGVIEQLGGAIWPYVVTDDQTVSYGPIIPAGLEPFESFGDSPAFDGEQLFVGARGRDGEAISSGAVYVFNVDLDTPVPTITERFTLTPPAPTDWTWYGRTVLRSGDQLAITGNANGHSDDIGFVDLYRKDIFGDGWTLDDRLVAAGTQAGDHFGQGVALDGHQVLVSAFGEEGDAAGDGAAYMFSTLPKAPMSGLAPTPYLAQGEAYGDGKPGSMGVPVLAANQLAVPGQKLVVGVDNLPEGSMPLLFWGLGGADIPFDGGSLLVADPTVIVLPPVGLFGQVGVGGDVPDDLALAGLAIHMQVMFVDPGAAGAHQTAQTNGLRLVIGH